MNIRALLEEDTRFTDLTTQGLGISALPAQMEFKSKKSMVLCGCAYVKNILDDLKIDYTFYAEDGDLLSADAQILTCSANADLLHKAWKISQNIFEYLSGIAHYTYEMRKIAHETAPHLVVATTRKNFPGAKEMMIEAVMCGGGVIHRLGLYDSVLVFKEHQAFFETPQAFENAFKKLKQTFIEKKIIVEVDSYEEASYFAKLGADVLQCEKMDTNTLSQCVSLKKHYPALIVSATGGVTLENIASYAQSGVDMVATSAPYHAKPMDVKVLLTQTNKIQIRI